MLNKNYIVEFEYASDSDFEERYENMRKLEEKTILEQVARDNAERVANMANNSQSFQSNGGGDKPFVPRPKLNVITTENYETEELSEIKKVKGEESPLIYGSSLRVKFDYYKIINKKSHDFHIVWKSWLFEWYV